MIKSRDGFHVYATHGTSHDDLAYLNGAHTSRGILYGHRIGRRDLAPRRRRYLDISFLSIFYQVAIREHASWLDKHNLWLNLQRTYDLLECWL